MVSNQTNQTGAIGHLFRWTMGLFVGLFLIGLGYAAHAEMKKMSAKNMRGITAQEGLKMVLEDFRISSDLTLRLRQDDNDNPNNAIFLEDLTLDNGSSGGVTVGSTSDPINFDIEGSNDGRWVIELPEYSWNIDETNISMGPVFAQDPSFNASRQRIADEISITNAQWAGGTRFALGTNPGGGMRVGIGMVLDGDLEISAPYCCSELTLQQIGGFSNCSNGPTGFDIGTNCSGVLDWASLEQGRPLVIDMFDDGGQGKLHVELNPNFSSGSAGQIVVEETLFNTSSGVIPQGNFGEIWTSDIIITNLVATGPEDITKGGYTGSGDSGYSSRN